jgi:hypothetical protein
MQSTIRSSRASAHPPRVAVRLRQIEGPGRPALARSASSTMGPSLGAENSGREASPVAGTNARLCMRSDADALNRLVDAITSDGGSATGSLLGAVEGLEARDRLRAFSDRAWCNH